MKRWFVGVLVLMLLLTFAIPVSAAPSAAAQTYTVDVGWENARQGVEFNAFFPGTLHVHEGDTVHWVQRTIEIHTVSFLAGGAAPDLIIPAPAGAPSPLQFNPTVVFPTAPANGQYDGTGYANSGIMSTSQGQPHDFSLTFTKAGTYEYMCLVHGMMMSGTIVVDSASTRIASPRQATLQGRRELVQLLRKLPGVLAAAIAATPKPDHNADGTTTHHVMLGYGQGQIDLMRFFPKNLPVKQGDTVMWQYGASGDAPHTVTFLNGAAGADLTLVVPQTNAPPLVLLNPAVLFPSGSGTLTREGVYNSGLLQPGAPGPGTSYSLVIGNITGNVPYVCLLHDESGMVGSLIVSPRAH